MSLDERNSWLDRQAKQSKAQSRGRCSARSPSRCQRLLELNDGSRRGGRQQVREGRLGSGRMANGPELDRLLGSARWAVERALRVLGRGQEQEQVLERVLGHHGVRRSKQRDTRARAARPWALLAKAVQAPVQVAAHVVQALEEPAACKPAAPYAQLH